MKLFLKKIHADLYCGFSFFSRLPMQWFYRSDFPFSFNRALWTWPLVSLVLGIITSTFFYISYHYIPSPWVVAFLTLGFQLLLTGGLHEDGLADMADGFGGGKDKSHKLAIMHDSRLGTYGVLTLFIILGIQVSCLAFLTKNSYDAIYILIVASLLSRIAMLLPIYCSKPARNDGLAKSLDGKITLSTIIAIFITLLLTFFLTSWIFALQYIGLSFIISIGITFFSYQHIQGYTGDILGAIQVFVATAILIASTIFIS